MAGPEDVSMSPAAGTNGAALSPTGVGKKRNKASPKKQSPAKQGSGSRNENKMEGTPTGGVQKEFSLSELGKMNVDSEFGETPKRVHLTKVTAVKWFFNSLVVGEKRWDLMATCAKKSMDGAPLDFNPSNELNLTFTFTAGSTDDLIKRRRELQASSNRKQERDYYKSTGILKNILNKVLTMRDSGLKFCFKGARGLAEEMDVVSTKQTAIIEKLLADLKAVEEASRNLTNGPAPKEKDSKDKKRKASTTSDGGGESGKRRRNSAVDGVKLEVPTADGVVEGGHTDVNAVEVLSSKMDLFRELNRIPVLKADKRNEIPAPEGAVLGLVQGLTAMVASFPGRVPHRPTNHIQVCTSREHHCYVPITKGQVRCLVKQLRAVLYDEVPADGTDAVGHAELMGVRVAQLYDLVILARSGAYDLCDDAATLDACFRLSETAQHFSNRLSSAQRHTLNLHAICEVFKKKCELAAEMARRPATGAEALRLFHAGKAELSPERIAQVSEALMAVVTRDKCSEAREGQIQTCLARIGAVTKEVFKDVPWVAVAPFGSFAQGLHSKSSDLDLCLLASDGPTDPVHAKRVLASLKNALAMCEGLEFKKLVTIETKRLPLLKGTHVPSDIEFDISLNNNVAVANSNLLRAYAEFDERAKQLMFCVQIWATNKGVKGTTHGNFSSYAYTVMAIHFLQNTEPPVLPRLQDSAAVASVDRHVISVGDKSFDCSYVCKDRSKLTWPPVGKVANSASLASLLFDFFQYYSTFCSNGEAISIRTGGWTDRDSLRKSGQNPGKAMLFSVEDPFETEVDLAEPTFASIAAQHRIFTQMREAARILASTEAADALFHPSA